mgnify:CR=1 FL=1
MTRVWHLDLLSVASVRSLVILDAETRRIVATEPLAGDGPSDVVRALRTVMLRTVPGWPSTIVTDNARQFAGVGEAIGIEQRFVSGLQQSAVERVLRSEAR